MKTYHTLSKFKLLNKYSYKFLFVAFIGIHIPLLGVLLYTLLVSNVSTLTILFIILGLTLGATAATLCALNNLLIPIVLGKMALRNYIERSEIPELPTQYSDEVGEVLKNIQFTIENLDAVNKEKEDVTELISHDLKTPIHQSLGIVNLLQVKGENPEKRKEYLSLLEDVLYKQKGFLEKMLEILKSKNLEISASNFEQINISDLINSVIEYHKNEITSKSIEVINDFPKETTVFGHSQALHEVLSNLLGNAIKFSDKEESKIVFNGAKTNEFANITVTDSGIGFSEKTREIMFRKFVPGHLGTDGELSTGLGLYLSKRIMEKHNGTITPYSEGKNKGSVFTVQLPA